ncbi:hypothetical protein D3C78_1459480 [compost metagenome]
MSWEPIRAKKLLPGVKRSPVSVLSSRQKVAANCGWALMPVPTAVPPWASCWMAGCRLRSCSMLACTCWAQPSSTWLMRTGMASIRWVRPVFTKGCTSRDFSQSTLSRWPRAGSRRSLSSMAALAWMVVGMMSLLL